MTTEAAPVPGPDSPPERRGLWPRLRALVRGRTGPDHEAVALPAMLLATGIGATNILCIKGCLRAGFQPMGYGTLRFLIVGTLGLLWLRARGIPLRPRDPLAHRWLLGETAAKAVGAFCIYHAVNLLPASTVLILSFSFPFLLMLLAGPTLADRVEAVRAAGMALGTAGLLVYALFLDQEAAAAPGHLALGIGLSLVGLAFTALMSVCTKRATRRGADPLQSMVYTALGPGLLWAPLAVKFEGLPTGLPHSWQAWALFTYATTVAGLFLFVYRRWLLRHYRISYMAGFAPASNALGIAGAVLLLGEVPPPRGLVTVALIGLGALLAWGASRGARAGA